MALVKVDQAESSGLDSCLGKWGGVKSALRVFVVYNEERITLDIQDKWTVYDVKEAVRHVSLRGGDFVRRMYVECTAYIVRRLYSVRKLLADCSDSVQCS